MTQATRSTVLLRRAIVALAVAIGLGATILLIVSRAARAAQVPGAVEIDPELARGAFLAAALSTSLATLAAGYAVGRVGSAAIGAIAEKPELFGRVLVLVGLAEGIAIYGLIVSILILNRIV
jgi:V/A-type H+/Na+-transporting ATPase subunit K